MILFVCVSWQWHTPTDVTAVAPDEKLGQCTRTSVLHVEQKPLILVENNTAEVLWEFRLQTYKQAAGQPIRHSGGFQRQMWPSQWAATSGARVLSFPILVIRALFLNHKSSVVLYNRGMGQQFILEFTVQRFSSPIKWSRVRCQVSLSLSSSSPVLPSSFCTSE